MGIVPDHSWTKQRPMATLTKRPSRQADCDDARQWSEVPVAGKQRKIGKQKSSTDDRTAEGGKLLLIQTRNIILIV